MKAVGVFALICIAALSTANADGTCESYVFDYDYQPTFKTCYMKTTAIDSKEFSITSDRDESFEKFNAEYNKKLEYLPNNLGAKFPSLLILNAGECAIREVSKDNFKGLGNLRKLYLERNQIEKIDDDTFEFIPAVEWIWLYGNKIKKLNGRAFASLHKLTEVHLASNDCINERFINEYFMDATRLAELPRVVSEKCGFTEPEPSPTKIVESEADLMTQSEKSSAKITDGS